MRATGCKKHGAQEYIKNRGSNDDDDDEEEDERGNEKREGGQRERERERLWLLKEGEYQRVKK